MSYRIKEHRLKVRCVQVQAIHACGIVSEILPAAVYIKLRHSQISMLISVVMYLHTHTVHTCYIKMAFAHVWVLGHLTVRG